MATLSTLQDFWDLGKNTLVDFLQYTWTCCTCIISAVELKLPIIESSEEQQAKLNKDYAGRLNITPFVTH